MFWIFALFVMVLPVGAVAWRHFLDRPLTPLDAELARVDESLHA